MAIKISYQNYLMAILKRSIASMEGIDRTFTIITYLCIILISVLAMANTDSIPDDLEKFLKYLSAGWLVFAFLFVSPYKEWAHGRLQLNEIEEAQKPKIHCGWRIAENGCAEIMLQNVSTKSLSGILLSFRNYRKADGSDVKDIIHPVLAVGESSERIQLDPGIQMFYRFARLKKDDLGRVSSFLTPSGHKEIRFFDDEIGVKFTVSGDDICGSTVFLRLKINDDKLEITGPFNNGENAVTPATQDVA